MWRISVSALTPPSYFLKSSSQPLPAFSLKFTGGGVSGIAISTDHPVVSGGIQSVRLIPNKSSGTLYKQLPTNYNLLYMRYYIKYLGNVSHHAGAYMGGYSPSSSYPQGDAGLKGVRSNGDKLFNAGFEQSGAPDAVRPQTHIGTYNNWVDMQGPAFSGLYYGRDLLVTENAPLQVGAWQCVEMRIKMNTTQAGHEGELQFWVNDNSLQNLMPGSPTGTYNSAGNWVTGSGSGFPGLQWRDVLTYGVNWIKLQNYSEAGTPYDVLFDDLVVATSPIGCINSGSVDIVPPATPTNLRVLP
ncbi:MAG: hypothetical protein ABIR36_03235 [Nitrospiraceae bacterium]